MLLVRMSTGREYAIALDDLQEADRTGVRSTRLSPRHDYVSVTQESGKRFVVVWDMVLYLAEPDYPYYKGRPSQKALEEESAQRIAGRVRALRKRRGLTITALAQASRMARPNLSRLEHGKHLPSLDTLERIAKALRVPVVELVAVD